MSENVANKLKKKGGRVCCVPGCSHNERNYSDLTFYRFPNRNYETERKKFWVNAVRRAPTDQKPWVPKENTRICSAHFVGGEKSNDPRKTAYNPTIFPWKKENPTVIAREKRLEKRTKDKNVTTLMIEDITSDFVDISETSLPPPSPRCNTREIEIQTDYIDCPNDEVLVTTLFCWQDSSKYEASTQTFIPIDNSEKTKVRIFEVQVPVTKPSKTVRVGPDTASREYFQGFKSITDDKCMKQLGGVTLSFFYILLNFINPKVEGQSKFYRVFDSKDRLLLFLMKMKLGLPFTAISCLFNIGSQTASRIFFEVLETIYISTKTWIFWPSKEAVKGSMPSSFQNYPNCRVIIDCTELNCETPPTTEQRALMYSSYKSGFTIKFLIGITPHGFISFVSKGYGGRSSDSFIVNDSGFLELIELGDEVMADKGFPQIRTELTKHGSILIMPPFATNPQFTREEVLEGYSVASVRIHVERSIQRIKLFKVLDHVPVKLFSSIDKIMHVTCVLANNKEPLIKEKE